MNRICIVTVLLAVLAGDTIATTRTGTPVDKESDGVIVSGGKNLPTIELGKKITKALEESLRSTGKRNPKFGFNLPGIIPGLTPGNNTKIFGGTGDGDSTTATIGSSAVLIKGGLLGGLAAIKAAILPPLFLGAIVVFLIAGAAFFACNILDCGGVLGGFGASSPSPGFGGFSSISNPFNRNAYEHFDQHITRPAYQAIEDGYKKYT